MDRMLDIKLFAVWLFALIATALTLENIELVVRIIAYTFVAGFTAYNWWMKYKEKRKK
ncbi:hypothetical protein IT417_03645 [bacterium]|nr:hypothetical protein [bacterium]